MNGRAYRAAVLCAWLALAGTSCMTPSGPSSEDAIRQRIGQLKAKWEQSVVEIGNRRQVFYDDALISFRGTNVARRIGRATKHNNGEPVLKADKAWETGSSRYGIGVTVSAVTNDRGKFQLWYAGGRSDREFSAFWDLAYAESDDGITWRKPLALPALDNIVMYPAFGAGVYLDPQAPRGGHRYKMVFGTVGRYGTSIIEGLTFAHSGNGVRWGMYDDVCMLDDCRSDTFSNIIWDEDIQLYRLYTRIMAKTGERSSRQYVRPYVSSGTGMLLAQLFFVPVSAHPWVCVDDQRLADPAGGQIYSMTVHKDGDIYIGFVAYFLVDKIDFCIALSRSGSEWDFSWVSTSNAVVERGAPGSPDAQMLYPPGTAPILVGDEFYLYYSGCRLGHEYGELEEGLTAWSVSLAKLRRDGFFYLENEGDRGVVETKAFTLRPGSLEVNADAARGALRVEVLDERGAVIPGYSEAECAPITTDSCRIAPQWNGSQGLAALWERPVKLRFVMDGPVRLYAFQVLP